MNTININNNNNICKTQIPSIDKSSSVKIIIITIIIVATMFMNSENSKISNPHRLLLNLTDKIDVRRKDKYIALSNLSIYYTRKNI